MSVQQERGELLSIMSSKAFHEILNEHKKFLQEEVNKFVRQQNLIEAFGAVKRIDDADKIVELINRRLEGLKEKKEG